MKKHSVTDAIIWMEQKNRKIAARRAILYGLATLCVLWILMWISGMDNGQLLPISVFSYGAILTNGVVMSFWKDSPRFLLIAYGDAKKIIWHKFVNLLPYGIAFGVLAEVEIGFVALLSNSKCDMTILVHGGLFIFQIPIWLFYLLVMGFGCKTIGKSLSFTIPILLWNMVGMVGEYLDGGDLLLSLVIVFLFGMYSWIRFRQLSNEVIWRKGLLL